MKNVILSLLLLATLSIHAQQKKWEHSLYVGGGLLIEDEGYRTETGASLKAGYSLGYYFSPQWSAAAGIAVRDVGVNMFQDALEGADDDMFTFLDVPIVAQYHLGRCTFGLGPVLSFCVENDTYYIDAEPWSPLSKLDKCKPFSMGMQPSVSCQIARHFSIGLDAYIGLTNIKATHGLTSGSKHLYDVTGRIAVNF